MLKVTLKDEFDQIHSDCLLIQSLEDLDKIHEDTKAEAEEEMVKAITSKTRVDRWDHLFQGAGQGRALMRGGVYKAITQGGHPITFASGLLAQRHGSMSKMINNGQAIVINRMGGYFPLNGDRTVILKSEPYIKPGIESHIHLKTDTKILNLENDPELESHAVAYMEKIDPNYSYVTRLDKFSGPQLLSVITRFKELGGEVVYIYTTGMNVPQMRDYSQAIIESGLKKVIFEFNSGINTEIEEIVEYLRAHGVAVTVTDLIND